MKSGEFYSTYGGDPYFNMAFDEWLFERAATNPNIILARLYTWQVGAITFGFNQNEKLAVDCDRVGNTPVIRRVTGGRALYHEPSELTYAIAGNISEFERGGVAGNISRTIKFISEMLLDFLSGLEINAQFVRQSAADFARPETFHVQPCFESHARHEIMAEGGKIVASAQRRIENVFLQHGAIKINGVAGHPALALLTNNSLNGRTIEPISGTDFERYLLVFKEALGDKFQIDFEFKGLDEAEILEIEIQREAIKKNPSGQRFSVEQNSPLVRLPDD